MHRIIPELSATELIKFFIKLEIYQTYFSFLSPSLPPPPLSLASNILKNNGFLQIF